MNYEEFFTKYPDMGWIENGEPHFTYQLKSIQKQRIG